jgi:hypothetical protein
MIIFCDSTHAELYFREQGLPAGNRLFEQSLKLAPGDSQILSFCLERLGNTSCWGPDESISGWTTKFLVYSLQSRKKLQVYKALLFFGPMFFMQKDEDTAISLFTVALEGFTYMDVHCSKGESMLRLGDISSLVLCHGCNGPHLPPLRLIMAKVIPTSHSNRVIAEPDRKNWHIQVVTFKQTTAVHN